jgi:hypothetical protein
MLSILPKSRTSPFSPFFSLYLNKENGDGGDSGKKPGGEAEHN